MTLFDQRMSELEHTTTVQRKIINEIRNKRW